MDGADREADHLSRVVRSVVRRRVPAADVDDVVQEVITRVLSSGRQLTDDALVAYAIVTARNLLVGRRRRREQQQRAEPRLVERSEPSRPDEAVERFEEEAALAEALSRLDRRDRDFLLAHELEDAPTASLAEAAGTSPGAVAVRLARLRAKLRVEYLLALGRVTLPSAVCKPVLLALSAGDRRRQATLDAGGHLLACPICAELAPALLERRRPLAAWWPWLAAATLWRRILRAGRQHPVGSAATAAAAAGVVIVLAVGLGRSPRPEPQPRVAATRRVTPRCEATLATPSGPQTVTAALDDGGLVGRSVSAPAIPVVATPSARGFWAGCPGSTVWVELEDSPALPAAVRTGAIVAFRGVIRANPAGYPARMGLQGPDAQLLQASGRHIDVAPGGLVAPGTPSR